MTALLGDCKVVEAVQAGAAPVVRVRPVSVLMQTYFPDREYGVPKHPGKLFNTLFKLYAREHNPRLPSEEVMSWVESPYSYQQIEEALAAERRRQDEMWGAPLSRPMAFCAGALDLFGSVPGGGPGMPGLGEESTDRRLPEQKEAFLSSAADLLEDATVHALVNELADEAIGACLGLFEDLRGYTLREGDLQRARCAARTLLMGGEETNRQAYTLREIRLTAAYLQGFVPREAWECETGIPDVWVVADRIAEVWPKVHALLLSCELFELDDGSLLSYDQYRLLCHRSSVALEEDEERGREEHSVEYHLRQMQAEQEDHPGDAQALQPEPRRDVGGGQARPLPWANPVEAALAGRGLRQELDGSLYGMELRMPAGGSGGLFAVWPRGQAPEAVIGERVLIDNSLDAELFRAALALRAALDPVCYGVEFQRPAHDPARVKAWSRTGAEEDVILLAVPDDVYAFIEEVRAGDGAPAGGVAAEERVI